MPVKLTLEIDLGPEGTAELLGLLQRFSAQSISATPISTRTEPEILNTRLRGGDPEPVEEPDWEAPVDAPDETPVPVETAPPPQPPPPAGASGGGIATEAERRGLANAFKVCRYLFPGAEDLFKAVLVSQGLKAGECNSLLSDFTAVNTARENQQDSAGMMRAADHNLRSVGSRLGLCAPPKG